MPLQNHTFFSMAKYMTFPMEWRWVLLLHLSWQIFSWSILRTNSSTLRTNMPPPLASGSDMSMIPSVYSKPRKQRLSYLNSCHPNIQFTHEFEEESKLPFLDILIIKGGNFFKTTIYHKKTFTGLYTKWDSFTPRKYKINLIRTLSFRCLKICSDEHFLRTSLNELKSHLSRNGYPPGILNYHTSDVVNRHSQPKEVTDTVEKAKAYISLPYLGPESDILKRSIKKCLASVSMAIEPIIIFKSSRKIADYFPFKDKHPHNKRSRVVYQATCLDCSGKYVGKTKKRLFDRQTEHFKSLTQPNNYQSSVADHVRKTGHTIDWDNFTILTYGKTDLHCKIKETLLIQKTSPELNGNECSERLFLFN